MRRVSLAALTAARGAGAPRGERAALGRAPARAPRARHGSRGRRLARVARRRLGVPELGRPAAVHAGTRMRLGASPFSCCVARGLRGRRLEAAHRGGQGRRRARIADARRPSLRRAGRRAGRRRSSNREKVDPADVVVKTDFKPYETVGEDAARRAGHRPLHAPPLHDDAPLSQRATASRAPSVRRTSRSRRRRSCRSFPENQQRDEKRKYEFPPAIVTAGGASRRTRRSAASSGRRCARCRGSTGTTRASSARDFPFVATVTPLPEPELPDLADAPRARRCWRSRSRCSRFPCALPRAEPPARAVPSARRDGRRRCQPARARARARRVGEPSSLRRRAARGARGARVRARAAGRTTSRPARARAQGWSPPTPEPEEMTELVASIRESDAPAT